MDTPSIVLDNGSGMCKAGFGGEDNPHTVVNAIVGRPKLESAMAGMGQKDLYVGEEAQAKRGVLIITYPIKAGIITNYDDMISIWHHVIYNDLRVEPSLYNVMLTEAPMNPKRNREKMADVFFTVFEAQGVNIQIQAVLGLYADARTTGMVLDSGDGVTHTVPIYEGFAIQNGMHRLNMAGRTTTDALMKNLGEVGVMLSTSAEAEVVRILKEKHCWVALDYEKTMEEYNKDPSKFECLAELPDKEIIDLKYSAFKAPECLFKPSMSGVEAQGISEMTLESIKKCDMDIRLSMYTAIVATGGNTLLKGFPERVQKDIDDRTAQNLKVKVNASPQRKFSVWIGGSILASLSTFSSSWIPRSEFDESGSAIVHRKCF
ncbi:MAG: actin [Marteilia pararefringens]